MSPPIVKCITKEEREKDGYISFWQWIEDPKNVYIGNNLHKYAQRDDKSACLTKWLVILYQKFRLSRLLPVPARPDMETSPIQKASPRTAVDAGDATRKYK